MMRTSHMIFAGILIIIVSVLPLLSAYGLTSIRLPVGETTYNIITVLLGIWVMMFGFSNLSRFGLSRIM